MMSPPSELRAHLNQQALELKWKDDAIAVFVPFRLLRGSCPCAACVNEMTGQRTYFHEDTSDDIRPEQLELVGNYAVRITWSDGHNTGLFTWEYLREIYAQLAQSS